MQYEIRRIYSADQTIGLLRLKDGAVSVVMGRDYYRCLRHGALDIPRVGSLADATTANLSPEVMAAHPDARLGEIEATPDLTLPVIEREIIPGQAQTQSLLDWLRAGALA